MFYNIIQNNYHKKPYSSEILDYNIKTKHNFVFATREESLEITDIDKEHNFYILVPTLEEKVIIDSWIQKQQKNIDKIIVEFRNRLDKIKHLLLDLN